MRHCKLLLVAFAATMLLGALVTSASAGRLSNSSQSISATWTRLNLSGGFGTVECEISLAGTLHTRTLTKTASTLLGYITAANVNRCTRGGATILRETLPWHRTYRSFAGTLPNITSLATNLIGFSLSFREPTFGASCLARSTASSPMILTSNLTAGATTSVSASGTLPCTGAITVNFTFSGNSSSNSALTVTLI